MSKPRKISLRIRRTYFDQIKAGTKNIEFRKCTKYWWKRLFPCPKEAVFICGKEIHRRKIKYVSILSEKDINIGLNIFFSEQGRKDLDIKNLLSVYAIYLGEEIVECECFAEISKDDPRYPMWLKINSEAKLQLKHPRITMSDSGPFKGEAFYVGDPDKLNSEQKKILINMMTKKFSLSTIEVEDDLELYGIPIRIHNVKVTRCKIHTGKMK